MSRKANAINGSKFLNIITLLLERQEKLLQHINDLDEYIEVLEGVNDFEFIVRIDVDVDVYGGKGRFEVA